MDLLTTEEYKSIATNLEFPATAYIDGGYRPAASGETFTSTNPATGETLAEIASCGQEDVDFAVEKAREAFDDGRWRKIHPSERKDVLIRFCKLLTRNARELAVMESLDSGKTIYDCETVDVPETIHCIKWHAEAIDKIYDQSGPCLGRPHRPGCARTDRRGRSGIAVELPPADVGVENRPRIGRRLLCCG